MQGASPVRTVWGAVTQSASGSIEPGVDRVGSVDRSVHVVSSSAHIARPYLQFFVAARAQCVA